MKPLSALLGGAAAHPRAQAFLKWQCRTRQIAMREQRGRPDNAAIPELWLPGADEPMGHIVTVLNKAPQFSLTPELTHMAKRTSDPAERREKAVGFFSQTYYQKAREFSDMLTATFPPNSEGAATIRAAERCRLVFEAYAQRFELDCRVWQLAEHHPLYQATWWHNLLFNPQLVPGTVILGFEPDWEASRAEPDIG